MSDELDQFLLQESTSTKPYQIRDRCGLRISCFGLRPLSFLEESEDRIWGSSIILIGAELEFPSVEFKLRGKTKRHCKDGVNCNRSKGRVKKNDVLVLSYQLPEASIEFTTLTLVIDSSPHEIPLYKTHKADYYWIGKDTNVPTAEQLYQRRHSVARSPRMEPTPRITSPGRFEQLSEGLKNFLTKEDGFKLVCKTLYPHVRSVFDDLAIKSRNYDLTINDFKSGGNATIDEFAEEIIRRFHESNRVLFETTAE